MKDRKGQSISIFKNIFGKKKEPISEEKKENSNVLDIESFYAESYRPNNL